jgi:hypothetical protein
VDIIIMDAAAAAVERPEAAVPTADITDVPTAPPQQQHNNNNDDGAPRRESIITTVGALEVEGEEMI